VLQKGDHSSLRQTVIPRERTAVTIILLVGLMVDSLITEYVRVGQLHALTSCEAESFALCEVVWWLASVELQRKFLYVPNFSYM
jgi:hypothetical protein